jgi:hypothetical protein
MKVVLAAAAVLLAACASTEDTVQCGPCAGPGYVLTGTVAVAGHRSVTECVSGLPCVTHDLRGPAEPGQEFLELPAGTDWAAQDGKALTVTVRNDAGVWRGEGTLRYRPPGGGPCDCAALAASVSLAPLSPRG